jgi:hypothetical protein
MILVSHGPLFTELTGAHNHKKTKSLKFLPTFPKGTLLPAKVRLGSLGGQFESAGEFSGGGGDNGAATTWVA